MDNKWVSASHKELRELYIERLMEDFPYETFDEIHNLADSNTEASLYIGSTGYEYNPASLVNQTAISAFRHGYCAIFAHCFNEKNGYDSFLLLTQEDSPFADWSGHVLSALPDGTFFDVTGRLTRSEVEDDYPESAFAYEFVSEADLWDRGILDRGTYSHPSLWLDPLERSYVCAVVDKVSSALRE